MTQVAVTRRAAVQAAAGAAAGLAAAAARPDLTLAHGRGGRGRVAAVPPEPLPGGIELAPGQVVHVWGPGSPDVTLPFSGLTLQGFDVEPTTIRDFDGFSAVAFHTGTATGDDGTHYDFEADMRAIRGTYVDGTGARRFGSFAFIWMDLFVPGTGTPAQQVHDFNGGILASGLFWTLPVEDRALRVSRDGRRVTLQARDVPVIDSFQFFGPNQTPASVSFEIEWQADGPFTQRGSGTTVPSTDAAAFDGMIATARSTGSFAGEEFGFAFRSDDASSDAGYAQVGRSRNGVFL